MLMAKWLPCSNRGAMDWPERSRPAAFTELYVTSSGTQAAVAINARVTTEERIKLNTARGHYLQQTLGFVATLTEPKTRLEFNRRRPPRRCGSGRLGACGPPQRAHRFQGSQQVLRDGNLEVQGYVPMICATCRDKKRLFAVHLCLQPNTYRGAQLFNVSLQPR